MRHANPTRREIGVRTAFNLLGPLTNPAGTRRQLLGVGDPRAAGRFAEVVHRLGTERTLVVHGAGVDELPLDGTGVLYEVTEAGVEQRFVDAVALGLRRDRDLEAGRRRSGHERALRRGDPARRAGLAARRRAAQRRRPPSWPPGRSTRSRTGSSAPR